MAALWLHCALCIAGLLAYSQGNIVNLLYGQSHDQVINCTNKPGGSRLCHDNEFLGSDIDRSLRTVTFNDSGNYQCHLGSEPPRCSGNQLLLDVDIHVYGLPTLIPTSCDEELGSGNICRKKVERGFNLSYCFNLSTYPFPLDPQDRQHMLNITNSYWYIDDSQVFTCSRSRCIATGDSRFLPRFMGEEQWRNCIVIPNITADIGLKYRIVHDEKVFKNRDIASLGVRNLIELAIAVYDTTTTLPLRPLPTALLVSRISSSLSSSSSSPTSSAASSPSSSSSTSSSSSSSSSSQSSSTLTASQTPLSPTPTTGPTIDTDPPKNLGVVLPPTLTLLTVLLLSAIVVFVVLCVKTLVNCHKVDKKSEDHADTLVINMPTAKRERSSPKSDECQAAPVIIAYADKSNAVIPSTPVHSYEPALDYHATATAMNDNRPWASARAIRFTQDVSESSGNSEPMFLPTDTTVTPYGSEASSDRPIAEFCIPKLKYESSMPIHHNSISCQDHFVRRPDSLALKKSVADEENDGDNGVSSSVSAHSSGYAYSIRHGSRKEPVVPSNSSKTPLIPPDETEVSEEDFIPNIL